MGHVSYRHAYGNGHHTKSCSNHTLRRANIIRKYNTPKSQAKKMRFWGVLLHILLKIRIFPLFKPYYYY